MGSLLRSPDRSFTHDAPTLRNVRPGYPGIPDARRTVTDVGERAWRRLSREVGGVDALPGSGSVSTCELAQQARLLFGLVGEPPRVSATGSAEDISLVVEGLDGHPHCLGHLHLRGAHHLLIVELVTDLAS